MAETIPRWHLPAVEFLETDAETIKAEIITGYEQASGRTLAAGDPVRLYLLSLAAVIIQQRTAVNLAAQQNLLSYAQDGYLDALGTLLSVTRLSESKAVTTIKFTLSQALATVYTIPAGTEVPMTFVAKAENTTISTGGSEAESDESLAERIRLAPNSFSVAGPEKAYIYHAKSVSSSVLDVSVTSPTPGEVDVYVLLAGGELPSQETLEQIAAYLSDETIRPLTDFVKVLAPKAVNYELELHYWISREDSSRAEQIKADVEKAVERYRVWQQGKIGRDILPARLIQYVMQAGASRIDNPTMKPVDFQKLESDQVAQCTGVKIVYEGYKDE